METNSFKKNQTTTTEEDVNIINNQVSILEKNVSSKDEEIKQLKLKLAEAQKINKTKTGDIRASINREGDVKLICVGVDDFGIRIWKKATDLSDEDIKKRDVYIENIRALNSKKYN